jgi:hypothetical protein
MTMVRLRELVDFNKIEEVAERVEKKRILSTMKLSDEELEIASQYIIEHESKHGESTESLSRITGLSSPCLRNIRDKKSKTMHTKTYHIFENIINAGMTKKAEEEKVKDLSEAIKETKAQTGGIITPLEDGISEYEGMSIIDSVLARMVDYDTRKRVIRYFDSKFVKEPGAKREP